MYFILSPKKLYFCRADAAEVLEAHVHVVVHVGAGRLLCDEIDPTINELFYDNVEGAEVLEEHVRVVGHVGVGGLLSDGVVPPVLKTYFR